MKRVNCTRFRTVVYFVSQTTEINSYIGPHVSRIIVDCRPKDMIYLPVHDYTNNYYKALEIAQRDGCGGGGRGRDGCGGGGRGLGERRGEC